MWGPESKLYGDALTCESSRKVASNYDRNKIWSRFEKHNMPPRKRNVSEIRRSNRTTNLCVCPLGTAAQVCRLWTIVCGLENDVHAHGANCTNCRLRKIKALNTTTPHDHFWFVGLCVVLLIVSGNGKTFICALWSSFLGVGVSERPPGTFWTRTERGIALVFEVGGIV